MKAYFLDTNIFLYAFGRDHAYKKACQAIVSLIATEEIFAVINTEVLQEILYYCWRKRRAQEGGIIIESLTRIVQLILPVKKEDMLLTLKILDRYKEIDPRDAIHAATMLNSGYKYIISADKHFDKIKNIQRINPLKMR